MFDLRDHVGNMDDDTLKDIIRDYDQFRQAGAIGDCTMRRVASEYIHKTNARQGDVVLWMESIVKEAYRVFAMRYLNSVSEGEEQEWL